MNTQLLKEKAEELYGKKYDLSKVEYINPKTRICITCPIHGDKLVFPYNFLRGRGCYECGRKEVGKKLSMSTDDFIEKAVTKHKGKYTYEKTDLSNCDKDGRVCITCPTHGEFWQKPSAHLCGCGCKKCKKDKLSSLHRMSTDDFIEKAVTKHKGKYTYEKTDLTKRDEKGRVCITCPTHGEFWQNPNAHLKGQGCQKCKGGVAMSTDDFIEKAVTKHKGKYTYEKTDLTKRRDEKGRVCITCPIHGEFWQRPNAHLRGQGCKKCVVKAYNTQSFIEESIKKYGDLYDYSLVEYKDSHTKVLIRCNQCGEVFKQTPNDHLCGKGCPSCKESKLEKHLKVLLKKHNIEFEYKKHFDWLGRQHLDFYLPKYNIGIECQGKQHFESVDAFGGEKEFIKRKDLDKLKLDKCVRNNIKLLYFTNLKKHSIFLGETLYKTDKTIINAIKNEKELL